MEQQNESFNKWILEKGFQKKVKNKIAVWFIAKNDKEYSNEALYKLFKSETEIHKFNVDEGEE
jgi:hypothetical protein